MLKKVFEKNNKFEKKNPKEIVNKKKSMTKVTFKLILYTLTTTCYLNNNMNYSFDLNCLY